VSLVADERTAVRVGAAALFLAFAGVVFTVAILPRLALTRTVRIRVYYTELAGMKEGAPVRSAGLDIGEVEAIALAPGGRPGKDGPLSGQTGAAVHLAIDPDHLDRTWRGGAYVISSRGPLAARYVEILPPPPAHPEGAALPIAEGLELRGVDPPTLDRVLQQTWTNLTIARTFFAAVRPEMRELRKELAALGETVRQLRKELTPSDSGSGSGSGSGSNPEDVIDELAARIEAALAEAERTWRDILGGRAGADRLRALVDHTAATWRTATASAARLSVLFAELREELSRLEAQLAAAAPGARFAALFAEVRALSPKLAAVDESVRVIAARWQRREGTLGRLLSDPEFPEDAKELGKILKRQPWRIFGHPDDTAPARSDRP
jgi:phospholipid/cholesterol/gamma-HCH transport system substrate-binding protein